MELHARLVHAEAGRRVVEVRASHGDHSLGSALAEAATAQEAEDMAVARLLQRLEAAASAGLNQTPPLPAPSPARLSGAMPANPAAPAPAETPATSTPERELDQQNGRPLRTPAPRPQKLAAPLQDRDGDAAHEAGSLDGAVEPGGTRTAPPAAATADEGPVPNDVEEEPPADPEDWSQELTAVDLQLRRLGWSREQEGLYLQRAFSHPSRTRLTRYSDLRAYLVALEALEPGSDPSLAAVPLRRSELLAQGDALLRQLGWSAEQGRAFLERQLHRISRQQLSDVQLLEFNMLLEGELLAAGTAVTTAAPEGAQR